MYRVAGVGNAGCTVPSECVQAAKYYPQHMNTSLVDDYCTWAAQGKGGEVEKLCLQAIMKGQSEPLPEPPSGTDCDDDADCDNGICEEGTCHALPMEHLKSSHGAMVTVGVVGVVGILIYYLSRSAG